MANLDTPEVTGRNGFHRDNLGRCLDKIVKHSTINPKLSMSLSERREKCEAVDMGLSPSLWSGSPVQTLVFRGQIVVHDVDSP